MIRRYLMGLALVALMPLGAVAATVTVTVSNFTFSPNDVTIGLGDVVHWVMPSSGFHTVTNGSDPGDPNAGTLFGHTLSSPGATFDFTFTSAGEFPYFCSPHYSLGMTGMVRVATTAVKPTAWAKIKALYH